MPGPVSSPGTPTGSGTTATVTLTDAAGATATKSFAIAVNVVAEPTIVSVTLTNGNGGTAGRLEKGDTITIVFSAAMDASTLLFGVGERHDQPHTEREQQRDRDSTTGPRQRTTR